MVNDTLCESTCATCHNSTQLVSCVSGDLSDGVCVGSGVVNTHIGGMRGSLFPRNSRDCKSHWKY